MTQHFDTIIIGGGLAGMTMACYLAKDNINVAVIDKQDPGTITKATSDGRVSAIAHGSHLILKHIGLWDALEKDAGPILDIRVSDNASKLFLHYDHQLVGDTPVGYMIPNHSMKHALYDLASKLDTLTLIAPVQDYELEHDNSQVVGITLDGEQKLSAPLLIAADGKFSKLRNFFGIESITYDYQQTGIVCNIRHELPHNGLAQERFLPSGPFAILPMKDPHMSSLVWTEPTEVAPHYTKMDHDTLLEQLNQRFCGCYGALELASDIFTYPLTLTQAKSYIANRLALIGDAAHAIHPLAGQGFNLGIRDIEVLAQLLIAQKDVGLDLGSAELLRSYNQERKFDALTLIAITDGLNRLFSNQNTPLALARRLGMAAVNRTPALKKIFMKHAMGVGG